MRCASASRALRALCELPALRALGALRAPRAPRAMQALRAMRAPCAFLLHKFLRSSVLLNLRARTDATCVSGVSQIEGSRLRFCCLARGGCQITKKNFWRGLRGCGVAPGLSRAKKG